MTIGQPGLHIEHRDRADGPLAEVGPQMFPQQVAVLQLGRLAEVDLGREPPVGQLMEEHVALLGIDPHSAQGVGLEHG